MNRNKLIPFLLLLLLLLLILCVWCHSSEIAKKRAIQLREASRIVPITSLSEENHLIKNDIDFKFVKQEKTLELTGNFSTDKSVQILHTAIGETNFSNLSKINNELLPKKDIIELTQKLLRPFNEKYKNGSISYANETIIIEGIVEHEDDKNAISTLLANSPITSQNNTRVVKPEPTAEELALIQAQKEAEEAKARAEEAARIQEAQAIEEAKKSEDEAKRIEEKEQATEELKRAEEEKSKAEDDAKRDEEARAKAEEEAKNIALEKEIKTLIDYEHINFELNKATLTPKSIHTIEKIVTILNKNPNIKVEIAGHTDSSGNDEQNLILSQKRVDSVKAKLIELQIDSSRLTAVGYGETQPLVSNDTKANRLKNRRVEFKVIGE